MASPLMDCLTDQDGLLLKHQLVLKIKVSTKCARSITTISCGMCSLVANKVKYEDALLELLRLINEFMSFESFDLLVSMSKLPDSFK